MQVSQVQQGEEHGRAWAPVLAERTWPFHSGRLVASGPTPSLMRLARCSYTTGPRLPLPVSIRERSSIFFGFPFFRRSAGRGHERARGDGNAPEPFAPVTPPPEPTVACKRKRERGKVTTSPANQAKDRRARSVVSTVAAYRTGSGRRRGKTGRYLRSREQRTHRTVSRVCRAEPGHAALMCWAAAAWRGEAAVLRLGRRGAPGKQGCQKSRKR